ncbi:MAG: glycosyltransferase family 4 protein [Senegalia sp. (in: firmicutes)]|uniref:glycosyltransferase family 4 protein n=1 Tax=Senegalia sp. (in: firmicutes) TaxID=1924098 RepID=UPI003F9CCB5D
MKELVIVTKNMKAGGAERVIAQLANYMSKYNIKCTIMTLDNTEVFYNLSDKVDICEIGEKSKNNYIDKILRYKDVRNCIKKINPDIVLSMPEEIGIYTILALLKTNIPIVVSERNNPWVMPWKKQTRFLRKTLYPFASGFIFQTKQASSFFSKGIIKKSVILPNPLDVDRIPSPWKEKRIKKVVGVGRLEKQKNFPLLIRAFAKFHKKFPDYTLVIYGEGKLRKDLEELSRTLLPEGSYCFPGRNPNVLEYIKSAQMLVLSSNYEGMPNVVIEAMAVGLPVISTNCPSGGSAELIEDGENGLLVPVNDVKSLYESMCKIAEQKKLADKLSRNAVKIKKRLDSKIVSEKWKEYLDAICNQRY